MIGLFDDPELKALHARRGQALMQLRNVDQQIEAQTMRVIAQWRKPMERSVEQKREQRAQDAMREANKLREQLRAVRAQQRPRLLLSFAAGVATTLCVMFGAVAWGGVDVEQSEMVCGAADDTAFRL